MALITSTQSLRLVYGGPPIELSKADWAGSFEYVSKFVAGVEQYYRSAPGSRNKLLRVAPGDILELKPSSKFPRDGVVVPTQDGTAVEVLPPPIYINMDSATSRFER